MTKTVAIVHYPPELNGGTWDGSRFTMDVRAEKLNGIVKEMLVCP